MTAIMTELPPGAVLDQVDLPAGAVLDPPPNPTDAGKKAQEAFALTLKTPGMPLDVAARQIEGQWKQKTDSQRDSVAGSIPMSPDGERPMSVRQAAEEDAKIAEATQTKDGSTITPEYGARVIIPDELLDNQTLAYAYAHIPFVRAMYKNERGIFDGVTYAGPESPKVEELWAKMRPVLEKMQQAQEAEAKKGTFGKLGTAAATAGKFLLGEGQGDAEKRAALGLSTGMEIDALAKSANLADRLAATQLRAYSKGILTAGLPAQVSMGAAFWNSLTFNQLPVPTPMDTPEQAAAGQIGSLAGMIVPGSPSGKVFNIGTKATATIGAATLARFPKLATAMEKITSGSIVGRGLSIAREFALLKGGELSYAIFTPENISRINDGEDPTAIAQEHLQSWFQIDGPTALFATAIGLFKPLRADTPEGKAAEKARDGALEQLGLSKNITPEELANVMREVLPEAKPEALGAKTETPAPEAGKGEITPPAQPGEAVAPPGDGREVTSTKLVVVNEFRESRGLEPVETTPVESQPEWMAQAATEMKADPGKVKRLIDQQRTDPKPLKPVDVAILQTHLRELDAAYGQAVTNLEAAKKLGDSEAVAEAMKVADDYEIQMGQLEEATKRGGTMWGRSGVAQQIELKRDMSLAGMTRRAVHSKGGEPLTEGEKADLKTRADRIAQLEKELADSQAKEKQTALDLAIAEAKPGRAAYGSRNRIFTKDKADEALKILMGKKEKGESFWKSEKGSQDPEAWKALLVRAGYHIESGLRTAAEWTAAMVKELGEEVRPILAKVWEEANAELQIASEKTIIDRIKAKAGAGKPLADMSRDVQLLAENAIAKGMHGREKIVDAVYEQVKPFVPNATRQDAADAIAGYGNYRPLSSDPVKAELRGYKTELLQLGKLADMAEGRAPEKTGVQRAPLTDEARRLTKLVNEAKRQGGYEVSDPEKQLRTALEAAQTRIENRMKDLREQMDSGQLDIKTKTPLEYDAETQKLRDELDTLETQYKDFFAKDLYNRDYNAKTRAKMIKLAKRIATNDYAKKERPDPPPLDEANLARKFELEKLMEQDAEANFRWRMANRSRFRKVIDTGAEVINTVRSIMTSFDLSAVLRQGGFIVMGHPVRAAKAFPAMFKALRSEQGRFAIEQEIKSRANYRFYQKYKLFMSEHGNALAKMEEAFMSRWAAKIPGVKASQRAYTTFLNRLRADSFDAMARSLSRGTEMTAAEGKAIANYINVATGRGALSYKEAAIVGMNTVFFAPRLVVSRFELFSGQPLWQGSWRTRAMITAEYARFLAGIGVVYGLGIAAGGTVESDPRSSDFGKIRFGNARLDPLSGLAQVTVLATRLVTGERLDAKGEAVPVRGQVPYGSPDSADLLANFLRSKLAPAPSLVVDTLTGTNVVGEPVTPQKVAVNQLTPMSVRDIYQAMQEEGVPKGAALGVLSIFGMGMQTYDNKKKK